MRNTENVHPDLSDHTLPESDRRELIVWSVRCAERVLPIFESAHPGDPRLREALAGALAFSRGELVSLVAGARSDGAAGRVGDS